MKTFLTYLPEYIVFDSIFGKDAKGNSCLSKVDIIKMKQNNGRMYNLVFIYFSQFMIPSPITQEFSTRINKGLEVNILNIHGPNDFWKVLNHDSQLVDAIDKLTEKFVQPIDDIPPPSALLRQIAK